MNDPTCEKCGVSGYGNCLCPRPIIDDMELERVFERSRQIVSPLIKREAENEIVGSDLLNILLRGNVT